MVLLPHPETHNKYLKSNSLRFVCEHNTACGSLLLMIAMMIMIHDDYYYYYYYSYSYDDH